MHMNIIKMKRMCLLDPVSYTHLSLFWFVGVHGPSIVEPAISAALVLNLTTNMEAYHAGQHATKILTLGAQHFAVTFGGTGATLVITLMFAFMAKSKELRAVGRASSCLLYTSRCV